MTTQNIQRKQLQVTNHTCYQRSAEHQHEELIPPCYTLVAAWPAKARTREDDNCELPAFPTLDQNAQHNW